MIQEAYVQGISTRSVDDLVKAMGMTGIPKSEVSRLCAEIDERVQAFLNRPLEGDWPYLWLDATYVKVRQGRQDRVSCGDSRCRRQRAGTARGARGHHRDALGKPKHSGPNSCARD